MPFVCAWGIFALLCAVCSAQPVAGGPVDFNERFIEEAIPSLAREKSFEAAGTASDVTIPSAANFDDPLSIFEYVFAQVPQLATVYPTETYYYFKFHLGPRLVCGNFRLLDADSGLLHIGYFDAYSRRQRRAATFGPEDGLVVETVGEREYRVRYGAREVQFLLHGQDQREPLQLALLDDEELICGILDESALRFFLVYDHSGRAFYHVLNEEEEVIGDTLVPVGEDWPCVYVSQRSRFVFYRDPGIDRALLVGVWERSVRDNDYFDGPFDQVPPRLPLLREKLEAAYPYVKLRGGIDEHGNFLEVQGTRVAISPYQTYTDLEAFASQVTQRVTLLSEQGASPSEIWLSLTYETKRDFHRQVRAATVGDPRDHQVYISQGWPANHFAQYSFRWPEDHDQPSSSEWPPNHKTAVSLEGPEVVKEGGIVAEEPTSDKKQ